MKKTFKFMAMALAALVMAGVTVSCDPMDKDDDQKEQTGGDQTGGENDGGDTVTPPTLEGKQWITTIEEGTGYCFDFGYTEEGFALDNRFDLDESSFKYYKFSTIYADNLENQLGTFEITPDENDATKGVFKVSYYGGMMEYEYAYKDLTENEVKIHSSFYNSSAGENDFSTFTIPSQPVLPQ